MTNASCADCGRIVAFRTHDPSEIAECRNCGTWVKRSAEMPGVAVSVKKDGPVARKTAIPARKDESTESTPNPNANTTRRATKRSTERPSENLSESGETLSAAKVYASIRDLQKSVHDLRAGQKTIETGQKNLEDGLEKIQDGQKALHGEHTVLRDGQKAIHSGQTVIRNGQKALNNSQKALFSGQKQLFGQYQELQRGQQTILEGILPLSEMPSPRESAYLTSSATPLGPLSSLDPSAASGDGFYTTPFSSLKIPLIPIALEDLDYEPKFTMEGTVPAIPADERSDREGLIDGQLPEPPPYVEPEIVADEEDTESEEKEEVAPSPFEEFSFDDSVFETTEETLSFPKEEFKEHPSLPEHGFLPQETSGEKAPEETPEQDPSENTPLNESPKAEDSFLTTVAHPSPFTIEGPPDDPFTIADDSEETLATEEQSNPFAKSPSANSPFGIQPFGAQEFTHDPCELDDPFAVDLDGAPVEDAANAASPFSDEGTPFSDDASPFSDQGTPFSDEGSPFSDEGSPFTQTSKDSSSPSDKGEKDEKSLSQKIAAAKEQHEASSFDPSQKGLLTDPKKSSKRPLLAVAIGILAAIGAYLFFLTDAFKGKEAGVAQTPPLIEFPARGIPLPQDDERIAEAEVVATQFLQAKSREEVEKIIQPVDSSLLVDFWEPITAPTIERLFQGRVLENDRVEIDFLINDIKGNERILPLVKTGESPFLVNWKSFAECEDATLLGLAQGTLILDSGEELDEGAIRSYVQDGKELKGKMDLGNFQGFKLHNFTEEVVALGVVRKDSPEFKILTDAIASTELKHKGKPAIRAVLRVKLIEEEDVKTKRPARLEVLKVISIDGKEEDEIIKERLPEVPKDETTTPETPEEAAPQEKRKEAIEAPLPPVPAPGDPLVNTAEETPLFEITYE